MNAQKETVIIVHGTWAGLRPGSLQWYQLDQTPAQESFASKLDRALEERRSPARCWAHCTDGTTFTWSGDNSWVGRAHASAELATYINRLQAEGWRCHIVAHSHGGNIVAEALPAIVASPARPQGITGTVATLGTAFIDAMSPVAHAIDRRRRIAGAIAWIFLSLLAGLLLFVGTLLFMIYLLPSLAHKEIDNLFLLPFVIAPVVLGYWGIRREFKRQPSGWHGYWSGLKANKSTTPFFLGIGSSLDEAWQVLHHMRNIENPLAIKANLISYLWQFRRLYLQRQSKIQRIQGATYLKDLPWHAKAIAAALIFVSIFFSLAFSIPKNWRPLHELAPLIGGFFAVWLAVVSCMTFLYGRSFYSAMWSPARWLLGHIRLLKVLPAEIVTYIVRRRGWTILQELAFGLEGYRYPLPTVERAPSYVPAACFAYEDLPGSVEARALERRNDWLTRNFGEATKTFANVVVTASDITALLRAVANDLSLVHAAYYSDDECVGRVADWIASGRAK